MLFNSIDFLFFFPIVTLLYFLLPHNARWILLLAASCFFYMFFKPVYILILAFTIVIDYYAGILIENAQKPRRRKAFLIMSLIANIGVLAVFKYFNFINANLTGFLSFFGEPNPIPFLNILLPIGLSFHTFQAMSYTIEIYRGNQKAERHFGLYALFVMFYPQLVAGPIERPQNLLHQFREKHYFDYDRVVSGLQMMAWGIFKKVVIADRLAIVVNEVFNKPYEYHSLTFITASFFFAIQVYCDFSGYSDIAIGSARVMGFTLMKNFDVPYSAKNVSEFWRRWHISLQSWFNDYLFTPFITAKRHWGNWGIAVGLFLTFSISGLWHGAGWHYIAWGVIHAAAVTFELFTKKIRRRISKKVPAVIYNSASTVITFCFLSWSFIFFRAKSMTEALYIVKNLFTNLNPQVFFSEIFSIRYFNKLEMIYALVFILFLEAIDYYRNNYGSMEKWIRSKPVMIRWNIYIIAIIGTMVFGIFRNQTFIYFQF